MKKELLERIKEIEITYDYEESNNNLYNTVIDYMNDIQDFELEYLFEDFISYDMAEEMAKHEIENGGLTRMQHFLPDMCNANLFKINGYGNLENITKEDLDFLKESIIDELKED